MLELNLNKNYNWFSEVAVAVINHDLTTIGRDNLPPCDNSLGYDPRELFMRFIIWRVESEGFHIEWRTLYPHLEYDEDYPEFTDPDDIQRVMHYWYDSLKPHRTAKVKRKEDLPSYTPWKDAYLKDIRAQFPISESGEAMILSMRVLDYWNNADQVNREYNETEMTLAIDKLVHVERGVTSRSCLNSEYYENINEVMFHDTSWLGTSLRKMVSDIMDAAECTYSLEKFTYLMYRITIGVIICSISKKNPEDQYDDDECHAWLYRHIDEMREYLDKALPAIKEDTERGKNM